MDTVVRIYMDPADGNTIAAADDKAFSLALEEASAAVLLTVRNSETIDRARDLRRAVIEMAVSRAGNPGRRMPLTIHEAVRLAESGFINAARNELAAPALEGGLYRLG
ncbi:hypothetical protein OG558_15450 [Kribbella sp. NBC_01510]|uniref:hypothetical protein n=1 Tax=Kribbella sp. NBC_01510 TaxID=2903581 RepID=UPI00386DFEF0